MIDNNVNWLGNPKTTIWCIILILFTTSIGQPIVLYVSALGNVDASLTEAAQVDGATKLQTFWKIMWPQITPTTLYILVITTINSFQCFALIQLLTSGGPNHATDTIMYYILLPGLQAVSVRLRQRHGRDPGHHHRSAVCPAVQGSRQGQRLRRHGR